MNTVLVEKLEEQEIEAEAASAAGGVPACGIPTPKAKARTITIPKRVAPHKSVDEDTLKALIHGVETVDQQSVLKRLNEYEDKHEENYFVIGGLLSVIRRNKWYGKSFDRWVEENTAMSRATAHGLARVYEQITKSEVPWAQVGHLGWTKLLCIARILTKDNAEEWIKRAEERPRAALGHLVNKARHNQSSTGLSIAAPALNWALKVKKNQPEVFAVALKRAKTEAQAPSDSAAVKLIFDEYANPPTLVAQLKKAGLKTTLAALAEAFPNGKFIYDGDTPLAHEEEHA